MAALQSCSRPVICCKGCSPFAECYASGCKCRNVGAAEVVVCTAGAAREQVTAMSAAAGAELQSPKQLLSQAERLQQARRLRGSPSRARQELSQQSLLQLQELELQLQAHSPGHIRSPAGRGAGAGDFLGLLSCVSLHILDFLSLKASQELLQQTDRNLLWSSPPLRLSWNHACCKSVRFSRARSHLSGAVRELPSAARCRSCCRAWRPVQPLLHVRAAFAHAAGFSCACRCCPESKQVRPGPHSRRSCSCRRAESQQQQRKQRDQQRCP